jgi:hypothetical protein
VALFDQIGDGTDESAVNRSSGSRRFGVLIGDHRAHLGRPDDPVRLCFTLRQVTRSTYRGPRLPLRSAGDRSRLCSSDCGVGCRGDRVPRPGDPLCKRSRADTRRRMFRRHPDGHRYWGKRSYRPLVRPPDPVSGRESSPVQPLTGMEVGMEAISRRTDNSAVREIHSIRRPDMAREMTSCWICSVPSKMSWITVGRLVRVLSCRPVR